MLAASIVRRLKARETRLCSRYVLRRVYVARRSWSLSFQLAAPAEQVTGAWPFLIFVCLVCSSSTVLDENEPVFGFYLVPLIIAIHIVCLVRSSSTVARCEWSCSGIPFRCSIPVLVKQDVNEPVLGIPCRIVIQWHFFTSWLVF